MESVRRPRARPAGERPARRAAASPVRRISDADLEELYRAFFREQGNSGAAIEAYKAARNEFQTLGMRSEVAGLSLILADLFLDRSEDQAATAEILAALPITEELKMVPERTAALSLLRESLRRQKVNRCALRDPHGHFEERKG